MGRTLAEKVWDAHVVRQRPKGEPDLLYVDLHLVHEVTSPQAFDGLRLAGRGVRRPDLTIATEDHNTPTIDIDKPIADPVSRTQIETLRRNCAEFGIRLHPLGDAEQGIVHVVGPQLGLTQPGLTVVCGDSHTSTHGAFGALAFGIGTSEVEHVLATQTLPLTRPSTMAITLEGELPEGTTAKDVILAVIARIGTGGGQGYVLEYRGEAIRALSMEARMTICNMSIEAGARAGMIAPDETTFAYLQGRPHAPSRRRLGRGRRVLADAAHRRRRRLRRRGRARRRRDRTLRDVGHQPRPGPAAVGQGARPRGRRRCRGARRGRARAGLHGSHGPERRCARSRSTRSSSARARTAASRTCAPPPSVVQGRRKADGVRVLVVPGQRTGASAGRGRGAGQGLRGLRGRVAQRRLFDVPGHEPRPARAGGAQRVDLQPQLRGPPGQGRAHPPRLAAGRRRRPRRSRPGRPPFVRGPSGARPPGPPNPRLPADPSRPA